ncbi:MAG: hypothetical protein HUU41_17220 [Bryobacteraceae bacterium]|nr:hypothetical protein [Bryobacterales bacterium]MEB2363741.1 hypothetical protein [Bryobacterales bacterium]NUN02854.1 hypothetical protein [Bryobacteraceae bacterium]
MKDWASLIEMGDLSVSNQLLSGFYDIEMGRWRWTIQNFSVILKPPSASEQNGATLLLRLFIPAVQIDKLGPITLSSEVDDQVLDPQTFYKPGEYTYARDLPPVLLATNVPPVRFCLARATPRTENDGRELGIVVTSAGLISK